MPSPLVEVAGQNVTGFVSKQRAPTASSSQGTGAVSAIHQSSFANVFERVNRSKQQHQHQLRYAPYSLPQAAAHMQATSGQLQQCPASNTQQQLPAVDAEQQQEQQQQQLGTADQLGQKGALMLQMAITIANFALESTVQYFNQACVASPGSAQALAALDAAEAAMAQTTRMTNVASLLAKRCMQEPPSTWPALPLLQHTDALRLQQQLQGHELVCGVAVPQLVPQLPTDDVEDGEEVSSSPPSSYSSSGTFMF